MRPSPQIIAMLRELEVVLAKGGLTGLGPELLTQSGLIYWGNLRILRD